MTASPRLGVVVPTLDEVHRLPRLLEDLRALPLPYSVVVSDGGSRDGPRERARAAGARVVREPPGRARQLNAGARALDAPWLLFLHADSRLPPRSAVALARWLDTADPATAAHFRFELEGDHWFWRFIELGQRVRERLYGLVYGDQGLLLSAELFRAAGGYPDIPIMEDVELVRRVRKLGRVQRLDVPLLTSPRRYEREGRWTTWLRHTALISLHLAGVSPEWLARRHPRGGGRPDPAGRRRTLLVFAKAPEVGRVKTRLGSEIGHPAATRLYRRMGRGILDRVRRGPYRTVVLYDPPGSRDAVERWLGPGLEYRPQAGGGLGERLADAFDWAFREADRVCVIGTDAPRVDEALVKRAFSALEQRGAVLGPAEDGGYYLVGLDRPRPELFQEIPWSTPGVLEATLARARASGVEPTLLRRLRDVDRASDLQGDLAEFLPGSRPRSHS